MALALLSTPEQIRKDKKEMNHVLNQLLQLVINASQAERYRYNGLHVSEPLGVLVKMFVVEERTLDYVLSHAETKPSSDSISTIQLFLQLFFSFSEAFQSSDRLEQFTLIALLNILWSISFQRNYSTELIQNQSFLNQIKSFAQNDQKQDMIEQYKPRSMEGIEQAVNGILINLNADQHHSNDENSVEQSKSQEK